MAFADIDGIRTQYEIAGNGPPLLMLAPAGFDSSISRWRLNGVWKDMQPLDTLQQDFTLIAYDRREAARIGRTHRGADLGSLCAPRHCTARSPEDRPRFCHRRLHGRVGGAGHRRALPATGARPAAALAGGGGGGRAARRRQVIQRVLRGELTQVLAGEALGLSERQVRRMVKKVRRRGARALAHASRGLESPRKMAEALEDRIAEIIRSRYPDFSPLHAAEKLSEHHRIEVSREKVRQVMMAKGLWRRRRYRKAAHVWRERRHHLGEMVQMDGSHHAWFEDRGDPCVLMGYIDDATGDPFGRFYDYEGTICRCRTTCTLPPIPSCPSGSGRRCPPMSRSPRRSPSKWATSRARKAPAWSKDLEEKMAKSLKINQVDKDAFVAASKPVYEEFAKEVKGGKEVVDRILSLR